jgi:hypothetical protein
MVGFSKTGNTPTYQQMQDIEPRCLARLTHWDSTWSQIGPGTRASYVKICKNKPVEGMLLCKHCLQRPLEGKTQSSLLHGLLTEPIPYASALYGGPRYWERVGAFDLKPDPAWLLKAKVAQREAEEWCRPFGTPWKVQRVSMEEIEEMKKASAKTKVAKPKAEAKEKEKDVPLKAAGTLLQTFVPIKVMYEESGKPIEKVQTDSMAMWKEETDTGPVWITETGLVFDCASNGEPGQLIAKYVKGEIVALD